MASEETRVPITVGERDYATNGVLNPQPVATLCWSVESVHVLGVPNSVSANDFIAAESLEPMRYEVSVVHGIAVSDFISEDQRENSNHCVKVITH